MQAQIILEQLGGNKFLAMTGSKNLVDMGNGLKMSLPKNQSKANGLEVTLNESDTYNMKFYKITGANFTIKEEYQDIYASELQTVFTEVTGLDTHL